MDLRSYVRLLFRRWPVFLLTVVVVGAGVGAASFFIPPVYTATARVAFAPVLTADADTDERRAASFYVQERMGTYAQAVTTADVLEPVIDARDLDLTVAELVDELTVSIPTGTVVMSISATGSTAREAASIANAIADNLPEAIALLEGSATVEASPVQATLLQQATPPEFRTSPNVRLNLVVAAVLALFFGVLLAVLVDNFDTRIRRGKDVTALGVPYLGGIDTVRGDDAKDVLKFSAQTAERKAALRRIALDVLFLVGDSPAHVVVTSALPGAGKTTLAANMAAALADAGNRVAYIDADVRGGRLAAQLRIPQNRGLGDVFAGRIDLEDALFVWHEGDFTIVPCGAAMAGVSELLADERFAGVLAGLDELFDVIIVDAPPVTNASEAARFTRNIRDVVVVAEAAETRRAPLLRTTSSLRQAGAELIGVALTRIGRMEQSAAVALDDDAGADERVPATT